MTAANTTADAAAPAPEASPADASEKAAARARARSVPRSGWVVVADKEFGDHLLLVRFVVLLIILGLAVGIPLFFASEQLRTLAVTGERPAGLLPRPVQLGVNVPVFQIDVHDPVVRRPRRAAARARVRVRRDQRRARRGDAAAAALPADLPRRRDQRQVRGRARRHRARPGDRRRGDRRRSGSSGSGSCRRRRSCCGS